MCGVAVTGSQSATGTTIAYAASVAITLSGFKAYENADPLDSASTSWGVSWCTGTGSHDTVMSGAHTMSETAITFTISNHDRSGRVANQPIYYTIRDQKLKDSDWTGFADSPLSDEKKAEWATYRQALRDLPESASPKHGNIESDGYVTNVTWPTKPTE